MQYNLFIESLNNIFPLDSALDDDKVGLQIKTNKNSIDNVLIAYELNDEVVEEAKSKNVDLIVVFHPLIYRPLQTFDFQERVAHLSAQLIKNDISLYVIHTCFDNYKDGSNKILADKFELNDIEFILPDKKYPQNGFGVIGNLKSPQNISDFISKCEEIFMAPIRYNSKSKSETISKIAIIAGSGTSFLSHVENLNVDAFITADVTYHNFHRVEGKMYLIDPGHYEMEQFIAKAIYDLLSKEISSANFHQSISYTNPVRYSNPNYTTLQIKNLVN